VVKKEDMSCAAVVEEELSHPKFPRSDRRTFFLTPMA
jgi:hypothetical protein